MDLDPPPRRRDEPPAFPPTSAALRPLRANPKPGWRWEGNGLLIGAVLLFLLASVMTLGVVESWSVPRRFPLRRAGNVVFVVGLWGWGLFLLAKGVLLRWRARE